jgi:succinoglycan biosynthesis protein ExoA
MTANATADAARVLVVIPTLDEAGSIETIIRTLAREKDRIPSLEIVVADGGSCDDTQRIVTRLTAELPYLYLINNTARIQGAAVNLAARFWSGRTDLMVRCDGHALYQERHVERLIATLHRTGAASVVIPMDSAGKMGFQKAVAWVSDSFVGSGGSAHRGGRSSGYVDHGHHAAFRLPVFLSVGGYDESFTHNEDAELDCRLTATGHAIYLDADIRITYFARTSVAALWRQYFRYGRGRSRTMRKHPGSLRLRQLAVLAHGGLLLASVLLAATMGDLPWLAWPTLYIAALAFISLELALRKRSLWGLLTGPAAAIMHIAWACGTAAGLLFFRESEWEPAPEPMSQNRVRSW